MSILKHIPVTHRNKVKFLDSQIVRAASDMLNPEIRESDISPVHDAHWVNESS